MFTFNGRGCWLFFFVVIVCLTDVIAYFDLFDFYVAFIIVNPYRVKGGMTHDLLFLLITFER